jgi:hypothetical protein
MWCEGTAPAQRSDESQRPGARCFLTARQPHDGTVARDCFPVGRLCSHDHLSAAANAAPDASGLEQIAAVADVSPRLLDLATQVDGGTLVMPVDAAYEYTLGARVPVRAHEFTNS